MWKIKNGFDWKGFLSLFLWKRLRFVDNVEAIKST